MFLRKVVLDRFCGFNKFTVDIDQFTVLVGLNNGGKTTVLRAIKFALEAFRVAFGDQSQPNLARIGEHTVQVGMSDVANRMGITDFGQLYFDKDRQELSSVSLCFDTSVTPDQKLTLSAACTKGQDSVQVRMLLGDQRIPNNPLGNDIVNRLYSVRADFIPPVGAVSAIEDELKWADLQTRLAQGKFSETWRNQLHWLNEGEDPEFFQRVVDRVREYLPNVRIRPPRRSKEQSRVEVNYVEGNAEYDISAAGGGLRTLLTLAAWLELSKAKILLFDEPDSHLHSSLQRQIAHVLEDAATERQILIATHAPDVIEEVPIDSLVWIERLRDVGHRRDDRGKTLVDLGAISRTQALECLGADVLIYFEARSDRRIFKELLARCGKSALADRSILEPLGGFGEVGKLPGVLRIIRAMRRITIAIAAIRDADYTQASPEGTAELQDGVLVIRLPCKELENLLLMRPESVCEAVKNSAERRSQVTDVTATIPSMEEVATKIDALSAADDIEETVKPQWMCALADNNGLDLNEAGQLKKAESEFQERWKDPMWRRRCCPGKLVLKRLRSWLQSKYKLTVTDSQLFASYEPSDDLRRLFDELEKHVDASLS